MPRSSVDNERNEPSGGEGGRGGQQSGRERSQMDKEVKTGGEDHGAALLVWGGGQVRVSRQPGMSGWVSRYVFTCPPGGHLAPRSYLPTYLHLILTSLNPVPLSLSSSLILNLYYQHYALSLSFPLLTYTRHHHLLSFIYFIFNILLL